MTKITKLPQGAIADLTMLQTIPRAVDHVTHEAAVRIKESANELLASAQTVAQKMNELADTIEAHGKIAADNISVFCDDAKHFLETTARLRDRLNGKEEPEINGPSLPRAAQLSDEPF